MTPGPWVAIAHLRDIPQRGARRIETAKVAIAVFRTADDRVFALEDRCPHKGGPLSQGIVHEGGVTCPLHGWVIDLEAAGARDPDRGCVRKFPVRVRAGAVEMMFAPAEAQPAA